MCILGFSDTDIQSIALNGILLSREHPPGDDLGVRKWGYNQEHCQTTERVSVPEMVVNQAPLSLVSISLQSHLVYSDPSRLVSPSLFA